MMILIYEVFETPRKKHQMEIDLWKFQVYNPLINFVTEQRIDMVSSPTIQGRPWN